MQNSTPHICWLHNDHKIVISPSYHVFNTPGIHTCIYFLYNIYCHEIHSYIHPLHPHTYTLTLYRCINGVTFKGCSPEHLISTSQGKTQLKYLLLCFCFFQVDVLTTVRGFVLKAKWRRCRYILQSVNLLCVQTTPVQYFSMGEKSMGETDSERWKA